MRVKDCKKCGYYSRKVWSQYYEPMRYHPIGLNHAYAFCTKHQKRCTEVKKCEKYLLLGGQNDNR